MKVAKNMMMKMMISVIVILIMAVKESRGLGDIHVLERRSRIRFCKGSCRYLPSTLISGGRLEQIKASRGRSFFHLHSKQKDQPNPDEYDQPPIIYRDIDPAALSDEDREIYNEMQANAPSDFQIRLALMGFTPLTIAGFAVAAVLILLNNILGYGWAADVFSGNAPNRNPPIEADTQRTSVYNAQNFDEIRDLKKDSIVNYDQIIKQIENSRLSNNVIDR